MISGALEIVDLGGAALPGGANSSALVDAAVVAAGPVISTFGTVNLQVLLWEFFLPGYTGDFRVQWTEIDDSSLDQLRVDSFIAASALSPTSFVFQSIPEPSGLALALLAVTGFVTKRRRNG